MKHETPQVKDAAVQAYVGRIGQRLAAHVPAPAARYPYTFTIADYREINAFALPGGPVWINRGAIQSARTESQFAGVLAHEIAHISQRHAARQLSNEMVANLGPQPARRAAGQCRRRRRRQHRGAVRRQRRFPEVQPGR